jgi:selenocysteine lyase/cysteine desulfurase
VTVELVPAERVPEALGPEHDVVAVSAVQSADGRVADLDALAAAAAHHGARTLVDLTQGMGWLPVDCTRFDYTVCAAYKWLLSPRGTAFFTIRPERRDELVPHAAGWYAGEDVHASYYGAPLRLAGSARRFDVSPAWLNWVGAAEALALLEEVGIAAIGAHDVALANRLRAGVGLPPGDSAIVSVGGLPADAAERLEAAGVMAAGRGGALRPPAISTRQNATSIARSRSSPAGIARAASRGSRCRARTRSPASPSRGATRRCWAA